MVARGESDGNDKHNSLEMQLKAHLMLLERSVFTCPSEEWYPSRVEYHLMVFQQVTKKGFIFNESHHANLKTTITTKHGEERVIRLRNYSISELAKSELRMDLGNYRREQWAAN